jgi:hypothetical protein
MLVTLPWRALAKRTAGEAVTKRRFVVEADVFFKRTRMRKKGVEF